MEGDRNGSLNPRIRSKAELFQGLELAHGKPRARELLSASMGLWATNSVVSSTDFIGAKTNELFSE